MGFSTTMPQKTGDLLNKRKLLFASRGSDSPVREESDLERCTGVDYGIPAADAKTLRGRKSFAAAVWHVFGVLLVFAGVILELMPKVNEMFGH